MTKAMSKYCGRERYSLRNFRKRDYIRKLTQSALFCSLIMIGAYIKIPFAVPVTLQLMFSNTSALLLGRRWGCVPSLLYLLLGLAGLPVFTYGAGLSSLLSPTFGFTLGFVLGSAAAGYISEAVKHRASAVIASAVNTAVVYLCGLVYFIFISRVYLGEAHSISHALSVCILPFIIPDTVKIIISLMLAKRLKANI